jgi:hypothetical protein
VKKHQEEEIIPMENYSGVTKLNVVLTELSIHGK